jgi:hypothetical protein
LYLLRTVAATAMSCKGAKEHFVLEELGWVDVKSKGECRRGFLPLTNKALTAFWRHLSDRVKDC